MRIIRLALALFAAFAVAGGVRAADSASVHAIRLAASNEKAPADPRLAPYEAPLQRNLPESSFRFIAESSAQVSGTHRATIALGGGHRLEVEHEKGGGIRLKLQWFNGNAVVIHGTFNLQPGVPLVLFRRPSGNGEIPILLVMAK